MRRLPPLAALRAFEAAARHGSFTAAAQELHQTTSAISHQMRALEAWFGQPLFERLPRQVALTMDGRKLQGQLTSAFDQIEAACAALRPLDADPVLAVHCAPSFAAKWLGPRLAQFMRAHPSITIRLSSSAEPVDLSRQAQIQVDISYGAPSPHAGVLVEALGPEDTVPLCAPQLVAGSSPPGPAELIGHTLIESKLNPVPWADWCRLHELAPPRHAGLSFDRGSLAVAAAVDGLGVALESRRFAEAELAQGLLIAFDHPPFQPIRGALHHLCYREIDRDAPKVRAFRDWLHAQDGRSVA